jgi:ArsR family transcriptional regulator, arsenate/arsenite/antimonite-responsive transcriptional repressor
MSYYCENLLMSNMENKQAIAALAALAQESRLATFRLLVQTGPCGLAASKIAEHLDIAPSSLSFHLKELTHAGLVTARQDGRFVIYSAQFDTMNGLLAFLTDNCCGGATCVSPAACNPAPTRQGCT